MGKPKFNLPPSLLKEVQVSLTEDDNVDIIKAWFVSGGEAVTLNQVQAELKDRIEFADEQLRCNNGKLGREQINAIIRERFKVTRRSAADYIRYAEDIFSTSNPLNKAALISLRIEFVERQIAEAVERKDFETAAIYEAILLKYIVAYPEQKHKPQKRMQVFVLPGNVAENGLTADAAFEILDNKIEEASNQ
ncbi:hypothetical protein ACFOW1_01585 [Parasediminibacterium paludis]|uniref:Uncharacterized protein n=1 Tax=Parasediminibacterium paludis TaxID=908966 RepID=A0ABV8PQY3_9BACT